MAGSRYGIRWMRNFAVGNAPWRELGLLGRESPLRAMLPNFQDLAPSEHPFQGYEYVRQFDGMLIEPPIYLEAMLDEVRAASAAVRVTELADRESLAALPERIVVNCTGLGSRALFGDEDLVPVKGQLTFLLPQPEVGYAVLNGENYMFPRSDGILLGGTHETGVWSLEPDPAARERILARHREFFDSFRSC